MSARLVTVSPQEGPTKELVTSATSTPNSSARSPRAVSASELSSSPVWTRTVESPICVIVVVPPGATSSMMSPARCS